MELKFEGQNFSKKTKGDLEAAKHEKSGEARALEAAQELRELFNKVNMEHFIVLDEETADRIVEKAYLELKEKLAKARGKGEATN